MHAAVYHKYGPAHDVISVVDDYPVPEPKDTQVLVRVQSATQRLVAGLQVFALIRCRPNLLQKFLEVSR